MPMDKPLLDRWYPDREIQIDFGGRGDKGLELRIHVRASIHDFDVPVADVLGLIAQLEIPTELAAALQEHLSREAQVELARALLVPSATAPPQTVGARRAVPSQDEEDSDG